MSSWGDLVIFGHNFPPLSQIVSLGKLNYRPQTKFAKVMFLQVSVCPHGGGACMVLFDGGHPWFYLGGVCGFIWGGMRGFI